MYLKAKKEPFLSPKRKAMVDKIAFESEANTTAYAEVKAYKKPESEDRISRIYSYINNALSKMNAE